MQEELGKALRSLPWYLVASILLFPLVAAPFTAGTSLVMYVLYFSAPLKMAAISTSVGLFLWILRQFVRAAVFVFVGHRTY